MFADKQESREFSKPPEDVFTSQEAELIRRFERKDSGQSWSSLKKEGEIIRLLH